MEVFISWSGERSKQVAEALRDWLPRVIQSIEPFMSKSDIDVGTRWSSEIGTKLEEVHFGLICLTRDNLEAPWLLFEAGALSKFIDKSRVIPYLFGITTAELEGPLAQFQAVVASKESTLEVLRSINNGTEANSLDPAILEDSFGTWWPRLEEKLASISEPTPQPAPRVLQPRSDREILEEVLSLCRQLSRQSSTVAESTYNSGGVANRANTKAEARLLSDSILSEDFGKWLTHFFSSTPSVPHNLENPE